MNLPTDILQRDGVEIAHRVALGFLDEARAGCVRLNHPDDDTALHDFRVAIRRLRSTLATWKPVIGRTLRKQHRRMLRDVQRATGSGRDAQVALSWLATIEPDVPDDARPGFAWIVARLEARLGASMAAVRAAVVEAFDAAEAVLRPRLEIARIEVDLRPEAEAVTGGDVVAALALDLEAALRAHLAGVQGIADEEGAHDARIAGKRLRYHVEPFRGLLPEAKAVVRACRHLQDVLGDINDCNVLRAWLAARDAEAPADAGPGLAWVRARIDQRHHELHTRFEADWLADGGGILRGRVAALVAAIETHTAPPQEIERKFLLARAPRVPDDAEIREIEQGYLPVDGYEDRVRCSRVGDAVRHVRTLKFGSGLARYEAEHVLDRSTFDALWPLTEGARIRKRRHTVVAGAHVWEVDEFLDRDLWLAEVELASEDEEAVMPGWLASAVARDVTESGEYGNRRLAR